MNPKSVSQELLDVLSLSLIEGIGPVTAKTLISYLGSPGAVLKANKGKLLKVPGVGESIAQLIIGSSAFEKADLVLKQCAAKGIQLHSYLDEQYPSRLKSIMEAPMLFYAKGNIPWEAEKTVGVVGTRSATEYGKSVTEQIVAELAVHEAQIISGLAYGIDIAAHKSALQHGLSTIGVSAAGPDRVYPSVHTSIARQMEENGGMISEYPPGTKPMPAQFPARNRIIAALSDVLIVVEAAEKGGALITARFANDFNKEVYAVPGDLGKTYSSGCLQLISNHEARVFTTVTELASNMGWLTDKKSQQKHKKTKPNDLDPEQQAVYELLEKHGTVLIDQLGFLSRIEMSRLASILLHLEFNGWVKSLPGKKYTLS